MRPTACTVIVVVATALLLAGILFAMPDGFAYQAVAGDDAATPTFTTTASPTATGTPTVTLTPAFATTPTLTSTIAVTLTPTATPTTTATSTAQVYLPFICKKGTPTPTPTPTTTPTPTPVQFAGTTDQGKDVDLMVAADYSVVMRFRIAVTVLCPDMAFSYSGQLSAPDGWLITGRQFAFRLVAGQSDAGVLLYDEYTGEFSADFSTVQGTWRKWGVLDEPVCDNTGTWGAARHPR